jgi:hypothetical protein
MEIPITQYEITTRDIIETIFGSLLVIFSLIGSIIISNIVLLPIIKNSKNNHINIFILCIHIIIILLFIMIIIYLSKQFIQNKLIFESIFSFCGPIIAASSLFFIYNVKEIVNTTLFTISKNKKIFI